MFRAEPTAHASPPTGAVRASEPLMVKAAESAATVASVACFTRILTVVAIASATVHAQLPPVGPLATPVVITTVSVKSPFFEYSRLTVGIAPAPVEVQEMVLTAPTFQTSVPTGLVTVRPPLIVKTALESSETVVSAVLVTPPSVEYSSFTSASVPALVQVMVRLSPTTHVSPPLGAVRARAPRILKFAGDVEVTVESLLRVIRTFTVVEIASGTVQA